MTKNVMHIARDGRERQDTMKKLLRTISVGFAALIGVFALFTAAPGAYAAGPTNEQVLVDQAQITLNDFRNAPEMGWFRDGLTDAKGILIVPSLVKAGLIFGGSGGKGVFLSRDMKTGKWKGPAFYNMGSLTYGLQIGAEKSEIVILAMTDDAVRTMISPSFKFGADASVAAGPVGIGAAGSVAPVPPAAFVAFARSKGLFAGLTIEGAVVTIDSDSNMAFYGGGVRPEDIILTGSAVNHDAKGLRNALADALMENCNRLAKDCLY